MVIAKVTIIGASGTMGANVAGIFASFGDAKVYCIGRDIEKVKKTIPRIVKSVKADAIAKNLIPADFSMLEKCVAESDLVFESSKEDIKVKTEIAKLVGKSPAASCGVMHRFLWPFNHGDCKLLSGWIERTLLRCTHVQSAL